MNIWYLAIVITGIIASTCAFIWVAIKTESHHSKATSMNDMLAEQTKAEIKHVFNAEFREELKNRGRLHFEKIIGENAMFLQQDLRLTTSQLNEYMKTEITKKLQEEFAKYEESILDAKQMAVDSINKTQEAIEQQRQLMGQQLIQEVADEKARLVKRFEDNMAEIINHYVITSIGNQIDLNDQLEYILADMATNKDAIIKDLSDGA